MSNNLDHIPSPTDITGSIRAAFDSVDLCNELVLNGEKTANIISRIDANKNHLATMLTKDWFVDGLTAEQRVIINTTIASSSLFII